jgi:hypothetical protein
MVDPGTFGVPASAFSGQRSYRLSYRSMKFRKLPRTRIGITVQSAPSLTASDFLSRDWSVVKEFAPSQPQRAFALQALGLTRAQPTEKEEPEGPSGAAAVAAAFASRASCQNADAVDWLRDKVSNLNSQVQSLMSCLLDDPGTAPIRAKLGGALRVRTPHLSVPSVFETDCRPLPQRAPWRKDKGSNLGTLSGSPA